MIWLRTALRGAVLVAGTMMAGACTFSGQEEAQAINDVPPEFYATTTTTPVPVEETDFFVTLMFIDGNDNRVPIRRPLEAAPTIQDVLDGVAAQPTEDELALHPEIRSPLPPGLEPQDGGIIDNQLRVVVADAGELRQISQLTPERFRSIYGAIVCTLDMLPGYQAATVILEDADGFVFPVSEDATVLDRGVGAPDFRDCRTAADIAAEEAQQAETTETTEAG